MKAVLAVFIVLLGFTLVFGQGFSVGANLGGSYNMASSGIAGDETASGIGFGGGLAFDLDLMMFGVELDVMYSMYKYSRTVASIEYSSTVNNLVVPLLFKYKLPMPAVSPYFVLGPSLIYGLSGSGEQNGTSYDIPSEDLETDFGLQVGAGANIGMITPMNISPYARFQYNLTANDPDTETSESAYDILFGLIFSYKIK